ncbi:hypothetical protein QFZ56_000053 [Streptomyces achromogenes]|uniref:GGDEF domain-containing protein n=1 Tax=Streptomyces achromogenes TaxID=67255 RepID=A0ABU0PTZ5_STRAH|nr:hypothetical protein [Streptomyces achromogenes]MDQ0681090.1 hypothetical protein [Streptomyces achromogenes]
MLRGQFWTVLDTGVGLLMGRAGELKRPVLSPGPLKELNDALHELHLAAGLPTLSTMYRELGKEISRSSLHDALTGTARPPWDTVEALVEILATRSPLTSAEKEIGNFHTLWMNAARSLIADGPAATSHADAAFTGSTVQDADDSARADAPFLHASPVAASAPFWIIATDTVAFSRVHDRLQRQLRQQLYGDLGEALNFAGLTDGAQFLDRGDGVLVLVPAERSGLGPVLGSLLHLQRLVVDQREREAKLRLRIVVSQGLLTVSEYGWLGADLDTAFRLLDSDPLRQIMGDPAVPLSVAITQQIHDALSELRPRGFRPPFQYTHASTKRGAIPTWVYASDASM